MTWHDVGRFLGKVLSDKAACRICVGVLSQHADPRLASCQVAVAVSGISDALRNGIPARPDTTADQIVQGFNASLAGAIADHIKRAQEHSGVYPVNEQPPRDNPGAPSASGTYDPDGSSEK